MKRALCLLNGLVFFFVSIQPSTASTCPAPEFNFCSITIGGSDELQVFKKVLADSNCSLNNYSTNPMTPGNCNQITKSKDGCIRFIEFVDPGAPNWHQQMLSKTTDPCHVLIISGHHDAFGDAIAPRKIVRNRYVYSDASYNWEAGQLAHPGLRLDLAELAASNPVCGDFNQVCDSNGNLSRTGTSTCFRGRVANSGDMLLGSLLSVYLFACNMLVDKNAAYVVTGFNNDSNTVSRGNVTYPQRTKAIFNRAFHISGFQHVAPASQTAFAQVKVYLDNLRQAYGGGENFFTLYLRELVAIRREEDSGVDVTKSSDPQVTKLVAGKSPVLGDAIPPKRRYFCSTTQAATCSLVRGNPNVACELMGLKTDVPATDPKFCTPQRLLQAQCSKLGLPSSQCSQNIVDRKVSQMTSKEASNLFPAMISCTEPKSYREQNLRFYCDSLKKTAKRLTQIYRGGPQFPFELKEKRFFNSIFEKIYYDKETNDSWPGVGWVDDPWSVPERLQAPF